MLDSAPHINTFAMIFYKFDDFKNSLRYEYFLEPNKSSSPVLQTRNAIPEIEISQEPDIIEENDSVLVDDLTAYWVVLNKENNTFSIVSTSGVLTESDLSDKFAGPFISEYSAGLFLEKIFGFKQMEDND